MPETSFSREEVLAMARAAGIEVHPRKKEARFGMDALCGLDSTEKLQTMCGLAAAAERRKHQADIERWKGEAAKAEHWRALALGKDPLGPGLVVAAIQHEAAQAALIAQKDALYRSRVGQACTQCGAGRYRADGNAYHDFHRCDKCRHVPMWKEDGSEWLPPGRLEHSAANVPPAEPPNVPADSCAGAGLPPGGTLPVTEGPKNVPSTCWCETCRPNTLGDMRMILCPVCGNKRCPHATHHANACTGSNAPGQPGSSWEHVKPTAPGGGHGGQ